MANQNKGPATPAMRAAADRIRAAALAHVQDSRGVRVEDYLTVLGSLAGESAIVSAGIDIEQLAIPPGSAIFGDQINQILSGDTADLARVPADTVVGILVAELVPGVVGLVDFGSLEELYRGVAANVGRTDWGKVHVSVGSDHEPTVLPIRVAFELRPAVEAACSSADVHPKEHHVPCALALAGGLAQVRQAIDITIALRLALEVVFGTAKMGPMSRRAFDGAAQQTPAGPSST